MAHRGSQNVSVPGPAHCSMTQVTLLLKIRWLMPKIRVQLCESVSTGSKSGETKTLRSPTTPSTTRTAQLQLEIILGLNEHKHSIWIIWFLVIKLEWALGVKSRSKKEICQCSEFSVTRTSHGRDDGRCRTLFMASGEFQNFYTFILNYCTNRKASTAPFANRTFGFVIIQELRPGASLCIK